MLVAAVAEGEVTVGLETSGKSFLTIFSRLQPVHLHKDVGAIPYYLATVCGWKSSIAFFAESAGFRAESMNEEYAASVNLINLGLRGSPLWNAMRVIAFMARRGSEFDVVNFYHDGVKDMFYALVFKFCNPKGKVYCKLDMSHLELELLTGRRKKPLQLLLRGAKYFLSRLTVNLYTAETSTVFNGLANDYYYRGRLHYLTNGFACPPIPDVEKMIAAKENIILTVGNLGAYAKNVELLVDAVALLEPAIIAGWQVVLVGPVVNADFYEAGYKVDDQFTTYLQRVVARHPHLRETFILAGKINDSVKLYRLYERTKIFCLTSRYESFGIAAMEAMYFGNFLIATDLPAPRDLTDQGRVGALFPNGDALRLAELLSSALQEETDLAIKGMESHKIILSRFNWQLLAKQLDRLLQSFTAARKEGV